MRTKGPLYLCAVVLVLILSVLAYVYISRLAALYEVRSFSFLIEVGLLAISTTSMLLGIAALYAKYNVEQDLIAMKSDFISIASHEIRSPLSSIRWSLAQLRADSSLSPQSRQIVDDLHERVRSLIELTGTFLEATSVDHGVMQPSDLQLFDIVPLIRDCVARAQSIALSKRISVRTDVVLEQKIFIRGDESRLKIVFDNLLSNAIKYSPEGALVSLAYTDNGSKKIFSVHDQGIGIPRKDIKQIFKGFYRAQNAKRPGTPGSGFGLYMAKKIVDFHGGTITVSSKLNEGTTFFVSLPAGV